MDPRDVNRINFNNYYVGQNLDFLVRSKMRSESLSTPLKNTPPFYDDEVTSKMSLLGKRGYYDPSYIYGFTNSEQNIENNQNEQDILNKNINQEYSNPITKEQYDQIILPKEHYKEQMMLNREMANNNDPKYFVDDRNINLNNNIPINNNNVNKYKNEALYKDKFKNFKEIQTPQKLDNFQLDRVKNNNPKNLEQDNNIINSNINDLEKRIPNYEYDMNEERIYNEIISRNNNGMMRNQDKIPNQDYYKQIREYHYINELSKKNLGNYKLPLTKNQILQGVLTENFNKNQISK